MLTAVDVRRLALAQPGAADDTQADGQLRFSVAGKDFAWTFMRRLRPKRPRVPDPAVLVVRCELPRKEMLMAAAPQTYFDDDHYRGYPGVLVRLAEADESELAALLAAAARLMAPKAPPGLARSAHGD
jgi:hypothetical protein